MVWFFRAVTTAYTREAVITDLVWLVVNWVLDTIVLVAVVFCNHLCFNPKKSRKNQT